MNRTFQLGCIGTFIVLVLLAGLFILETSRYIETRSSVSSETIVEDARIRAFESGWHPPSKTADASWFPAEVGAWHRSRIEAGRALPELGIERPTASAIYRSSLGIVRVNILAATELEHATSIATAQRTLEQHDSQANAAETGDRPRSRQRTTTQGHRTHIQMGTASHTRFWWIDGWLFIFRARGTADSEGFPEEFLRAVPPPPAAAAGAGAERN